MVRGHASALSMHDLIGFRYALLASLLGVIPVLLNMLAKGHGYGDPGPSVKGYFAVDPPLAIGTGTTNPMGDLPTPQTASASTHEIREAITGALPEGFRVSFAAATEWKPTIGWFDMLLALQQVGAWVSR